MAIKLKLSEVEVGTPSRSRRWNNESQENEILDPCDTFLDRLGDKKYNWETKQTTQSLFLKHVEIPRDADMYHRNFLEYLEKCWADHLGIVVTPDILWFTVLGELVAVVKESPEPYRHLFTDSHEKKTITVRTEDPEVMPLNRLVDALRKHIPTEATRFMPEFTTTTQAGRHAMYASFCDLCSPYYNYMMYACGFPAIDVQGTREDWARLAGQWKNLSPLFSAAGGWVGRVQELFDNCVTRLEDSEWWKQLFFLERCGSGSQTVLSGWFTTLFRQQPQGPRFVENFPTSVASVEYKEIVANRDFKMQDGLFCSRQEGDFMVPEFGYTVHEKLGPQEIEKGDEDIGIRIVRIPPNPDYEKFSEWTVTAGLNSGETEEP